MKNLLLLLFTFLSVSLYGQCEIIENDSTIIDPFPYIDCDNRIEVPQNQGVPFSFTFQLYAPDSIVVNGSGGIIFPVENIVIDTVGAFLNLPPGVGYRCNPSNGIIEAGEYGCIELYKNAEIDPGLIGEIFEIRLILQTYLLDNLVILTDTLPDTVVPGFYCMEIVDVNPINEINITPFEIELSPNPADELIQLTIDADDANDLELKIYDFSGKILMQQDLDVARGEQTFDVDVKQLPLGIYLYSVGNEAGVLTDRLLIARE